MAGNYPDAPSWRMAYDRDGTIGFSVSGASVVAELTAANLVTLNDESDGSLAFSDKATGSRLGLMFPELRDVDAVYVNADQGFNSSFVGRVIVSADTTNGTDGTWVQLIASVAHTALSVNPNYRSPAAGTALAVRSVVVELTASHNIEPKLRALHVYGERAPGQAVNALELWHPSSDEKLPAAWLDWGNTPRGSSEDRTFRVKNVSNVSTAQDVRVAMDVLTDGSPSVPGQHLLSYGGGSFLAQVNVGDLAPGAISGAVTLRRVLQSNAQLGLFAFRVFAEADSWS